MLQQYAHAARAQGAAGQPVRRHLHRRAADEHVRRCGSASGRRADASIGRDGELGLRLCRSGWSARLCAQLAERDGHARHPAARDPARRAAGCRPRSSPTSGSATRATSPLDIAGCSLVVGRASTASTPRVGEHDAGRHLPAADLHSSTPTPAARCIVARREAAAA